jgi:hypothetical protein
VEDGRGEGVGPLIGGIRGTIRPFASFSGARVVSAHWLPSLLLIEAMHVQLAERQGGVMFATIKSLIPEPRVADHSRRYVGKHRLPEPVAAPDEPPAPTAEETEPATV